MQSALTLYYISRFSKNHLQCASQLWPLIFVISSMTWTHCQRMVHIWINISVPKSSLHVQGNCCTHLIYIPKQLSCNSIDAVTEKMRVHLAHQWSHHLTKICSTLEHIVTSQSWKMPKILCTWNKKERHVANRYFFNKVLSLYLEQYSIHSTQPVIELNIWYIFSCYCWLVHYIMKY